MVIDDLDKQILQYLQEDGRASYVTIANELNVSEGTIRQRVRKLEKHHILQIVGVTDPFKVGLDTVAFIWLKVERNTIESIIAQLEALVYIRYLVVTTGTHDIVAMAVLPSKDALVKLLLNQLGQIPGIISSETSIVLEIHKQIYNWSPFNEMSEEVQ